MRDKTTTPTAIHESLTSSYFSQIKRLFALFVFVVGVASTATANPADLDPSFGKFGRVLSAPDGVGDKFANAMALQADGKIVMAGGGGGANGNFIVARYNTDGSPDMDFGAGGFSIITFPGPSAAYDVAIQSDGKIVVGGRVFITGTPNTTELTVARLNADGSTDMTFDTDGQTVVSFSPMLHVGYTKEFSSVRIAPDGKIVLTGHALFAATDDRFMLARLNSDGTPDATFGTAGRFVDAPNGAGHNNELADMVILSDGSIVAAGYLVTASVNWRIVYKYNPSGTARVWSYQQGTIGVPIFSDAFFGIAALSDGKFIAAGKKDNKIVVARINADGTPDNTFVIPTMPTGQAESVAIQADGKIVANYTAGGSSEFSLVRFNLNGSLDTRFGAGGFSSVAAYSASGDRAEKVIVQPDGKILVGGNTFTASQSVFAILRYRGGEFVADKVAFDYDGDQKSDISVYRPSEGRWYLNQSTNGFAVYQFGNATDRIVPADYDGDNKTDLAVYRDGLWWILRSSDSVVTVYNFGIAEDKPQPGDFDGDGRDDHAVFRPSSGIWYVLRSTDNGYHSVQFGLSNDVPQRADYDDDGKADFAVFRPSSGEWYIQRSSGGYRITQFGLNGDQPVVADYDGDSNPDLAIWRPSNGDWYVWRSSNGQVNRVNWGLTGDIPVPADYDGDGKVDIAIFRPSSGTWYQFRSTGGQFVQPFGLNNDRPTPGAFGP